MAQTAPDFGGVLSETGTATDDAIKNIWFQLQGDLLSQNAAIQITRNIIEPKVLVLAPTVNADNQPIGDNSVLHFTGASSVNVTGLVAPAPGKSRFIILHNSGSGTITLKHETTSTATNRFFMTSAADISLVANGSRMFIYLAARWRQIV